MHTTAVWWRLGADALASVFDSNSLALDGFQGAAHALHNVAALRMMCEPGDLGRAVGTGEGEWGAVAHATASKKRGGRQLSSRPSSCTTTIRAAWESLNRYTRKGVHWLSKHLSWSRNGVFVRLPRLCRTGTAAKSMMARRPSGQRLRSWSLSKLIALTTASILIRCTSKPTPWRFECNGGLA